MGTPIVQIYEIQTPEEARRLIELGVDHIGSVITSRRHRHDPVVRETVSLVHRMGAVSSLIPLYADNDAVFDTLDYYRPHIVHFCDRLDGNDHRSVDAALELQSSVKIRFPDVRIMRSIPIGQPHQADGPSVLALAQTLAPCSDLFLTDTLLEGDSGAADSDQPVTGFVGITGLTCDWHVAAELVKQSRIPVILAGGVSPENVADGIHQVRPFGVDSCTCTNAVDQNGQPIRFKKDLKRVNQLLLETRRAAEMHKSSP
jgi:phosphoribosylanthranilate isomerase